MGLSRRQRTKNTNKLLPCRLHLCRVDLCSQACFQPTQWLTELQQTLHSPLLTFENFSPSLQTYLSAWLSVPVAETEWQFPSSFHWQPQKSSLLNQAILQKAFIQVAFIKGTYLATENTPPRLLWFITRNFRSWSILAENWREGKMFYVKCYNFG